MSYQRNDNGSPSQTCNGFSGQSSVLRAPDKVHDRELLYSSETRWIRMKQTQLLENEIPVNDKSGTKINIFQHTFRLKLFVGH